MIIPVLHELALKVLDIIILQALFKDSVYHRSLQFLVRLNRKINKLLCKGGAIVSAMLKLLR